MNTTHHLTALRIDTRLSQQSVKIQPLVSQRITFVNYNVGSRQTRYIFDRAEAWPSKRIFILEFFNPIANRSVGETVFVVQRE